MSMTNSEDGKPVSKYVSITVDSFQPGDEIWTWVYRFTAKPELAQATVLLSFVMEGVFPEQKYIIVYDGVLSIRDHYTAAREADKIPYNFKPTEAPGARRSAVYCD